MYEQYSKERNFWSREKGKGTLRAISSKDCFLASQNNNGASGSPF